MTPSIDWKEEISEGEAERFEQYAQMLNGLQKKQAHPTLGPSRGLHAKPQLGVEAVFTVLPDLPEHARQGLFGKAAKYKAYVRFSNGMGARQSDKKPDVRGIAVKVVGVEGKKLIPGMENAKTQDLLAILTPSIPFPTADGFVFFVKAATNPVTLLPRAFGRFGVGETFKIFRTALKGLTMKVPSVATANYFTAAPIKFGAYAVKLAFFAQAKDAVEAKSVKAQNYFGEELAERLKTGPVAYDVKVQFFSDAQSTPIEDHSVDWNTPWLTVGRLDLLQQDVTLDRGKKLSEAIEKMSFDPWHALEAHRPIGNVMRARNAAYRVSTQERKAAPEPDGTEKFD